MPKQFHKHKLLLDENMPHRETFPALNERFNVRHVAADFKQSSLPDPEVYELARKESRLLITYNVKDFKMLASTSIATGIIGVSANLSVMQIDKKLTALLIKVTKKDLVGKLTMISGEH